jgi:hypothetical protein
MNLYRPYRNKSDYLQGNCMKTFQIPFVRFALVLREILTTLSLYPGHYLLVLHGHAKFNQRVTECTTAHISYMHLQKT